MKKVFCILYYVFMALPIPISMASWIGTLMCLANSSIAGLGIGEMVPLLSMLLAGTYLVSYIYSLYKIIKVKEASYAVLPILHIFITCVCIFFWSKM